MTNTHDNTEINLKLLFISTAYYTASFHFLMNNMTLIRFSWRETSSRHVCVAVRSASPHSWCFWPFKINVFLLDAILVRVDSSSQRLLCVCTVSLERDPESAVGPWLCIKAGWASRWCRIQDPSSVVLLRHSYFHSLNCCLATVTKLTLVLD